MRKKLFTFLLALMASVGMSWATSKPIGYVDVCTAHPGSIHLVGWANDPDALSTSLPIHVYVDQPNGGSSYINEHGYNLGTTDVWREDGVNPQYTGYHKIDRYINIMEASGAGTYRIRAYALDAVGNDGNPLMPHSYLSGMPSTATLTVPAPYSITYNANGGNGAPAADYKCYGINKTLSSTVPTRDGYTFIGWNTEQNGSGTSYAKGATYSANAGATLYAQWKVKEVTVNLSTITSDYVIPNGATLTGTLQNNVVLTVADNATITLNNVDINWNAQWTSGDHAGITCDNATIILAECTTNKIRGFLDGNPGVYVRQNKTITIQGTGTLYAATNGGAAAIGSGYAAQNSSARYGGNIVILNGTIFATGGNLGAGIGSGGRSTVGNITIQGGIITATGGGSAAGIGCGQTKQSNWKSQCGNITITNGVKYLKATKGGGSDQCIGKGNLSGTAVCGTVTINGTTGAISTSPYTYSPAANNVKNLINAIGSVAYTQACKDKIDAARAAYEALADYSCDVDAVNALKGAVSNYSTLTDAEATYADLMAVKNVEDLINAIGSPITAASQTAIDAARNAYNALTGGQQALVGNYATLTDAEAALAVVNLINAIGSPITAASQTAIDAARNAYDALTNAQKSYVDNYATLTDAEAAYDALIPQPSTIPTEFANCYDCWRSPSYPKINGQCNLFNFGNPGVGNGNPSGPWKLEFVEYYNSSSTEYDDIVNDYVANQYGKSPEQMEVYRLYQWQNGAYQPVAYGVLYAYANESNPVEHAAFFEANGYYGCYLTGNTHSGGDDFNILFDEDAATGFGDLHGGGGSTPDPQQDPTIFAGFTVTDGCDGFGGEDHSKLVDGLFAPGNEGVDWTKWCADGQHKSTPSGESESCWWVDFNSATPIAVTGYILTTGNDNTQWGEGRNPNSWKIKAKLNAGDAWTTIATVTNDNTMQVADFTDFSFTLDQAGTYKYFRFMVYEPEYDNCMQLCEFRFTGNGGSTPEPPSINDILQELYNALGNDVWAGYGEATGVITYAQGTEPNSFKATFMGGAYAIEIPFGDFTYADKVDNGDGTYTYNLDVNLPAQTGMDHEVLHVTTNANGEITGIESELAETEMNKVGGAIATWADLNAAMANGGVLQLSQSLTAEGTDGALVVPAGKTVVLDLNGFSLDRHLTSAQADGCVIINNGTLAIMDNVGGAEIKGGYNSGNGGGIVNNGTFTLYGGKITGNHAAQGAGVYNSVANDGNAGFWMTGGLIDGNEAASYPAIKGDVTFSNLAVVQINAGGNTVSAATAIAGLATYDYIKPVMPNMDMFAILAELHAALGSDVWTGYGVNTGVISYAQGDEPNSFKATFMGGTYEINIPFGDFTSATKTDNGDGTYTYDLVVNLPAQTGMSQETLHVMTNANGEILEMESVNAGIELQKETDGTIATWEDLQNALNQGGVIKLTNDIVGGTTPLEIPAGKTVVLDLNGYTIDRGMTDAAANGSVIVNNGTLAIVDNSDLANGVITGGKTTGNGGGVLNNGIFTLYAGEITGNVAAIGGGVYNNGGAQGFWMTGGLIDGNTANSYLAIGGEVIFNNMAQIQINADGDKVSIDEALADMATYSYIKPVMPDYDDYTTEVAITANADPDNANVYYSTFYDSANKYALPAGVEAYVADLSGNDLVLTKIAGAGQVIPADEAVIFRASVQNFSLLPSFEAPVSVSTNNDLEGVDEATPVTDIAGLTLDNCYVLSGTVQYGVGFYKINANTLKAHKAYVKFTGLQNNAPRRMRFVFNQEQVATGMENVQGDNVQSTKVLENGVLYIIKNGVRYNVQGQIVK